MDKPAIIQDVCGMDYACQGCGFIIRVYWQPKHESYIGAIALLCRECVGKGIILVTEEWTEENEYPSLSN